MFIKLDITITLRLHMVENSRLLEAIGSSHLHFGLPVVREVGTAPL